MLADRSTLAQFLLEDRRGHPEASGDLGALVLDVALACKTVSRRVSFGALALPRGEGRSADALANDIFLRSNEWGGHLAGMISEGMVAPYCIPAPHPKGKYLLLFDPLEGAADLDVNVPVGSLFSILRAPQPRQDATPADFLQPGAKQVCAGYAIYGPSTLLVLTLGSGVHAFSLDPLLGEFVLTHAAMEIPAATSELAVNASHARFWDRAMKRYVDECIAGRTGPRGRDFDLRWSASLVAELHRVLIRGGIFLFPEDARDPTGAGRPRLLFECNPASLLVEQAGGMASTGQGRVLDVTPRELHQRSGLIFGSRQEVERVERYHRDGDDRDDDIPLFASRGLFRNPS